MLLSLLSFAVHGAVASPSWDQLVAVDDWSELGEVEDDLAGSISTSSADLEGVDCFAAEARSELPVSVLLEVVADVEGEVSWSTAGLREAELLLRDGSRIVYYQYLDLPGWTLTADRYWFMEGWTERWEGGGSFHWTRLEGAEWEEARAEVTQSAPRALEPPVNVGGWVFAEDGSAVTMRYLVCTDIGGSLPRSVQRMATRKTLPDVIVDVVREAGRRSP